MNNHGQPVLYAIVTGSPATRDIGKLVDLAQSDGWDVCVIASPNGYQFIHADAMVVTPITCKVCLHSSVDTTVHYSGRGHRYGELGWTCHKYWRSASW
jgi:hypothetical protein